MQTPKYVAASVASPIVHASNNGDDGGEYDGHHPALKTMRVLDCDKKMRLQPNSLPIVMSNEFFEGKVMLLVRTPDVDDPRDEHAPHMSTEAKIISKYFKGKKRRFEFQLQFKLKRLPKGPLFLAMELERPAEAGILTKGLLGVILAVLRRINPGSHNSLGADKEKLDPQVLEMGAYELPHLAFPVEATMDRVVVTKPGGTPPVLGHEIHESNASVKRRRKKGTGSIGWNLRDTYTMCLWSAYCDWIQWQVLHLPAVSPFSLCHLGGEQPLYMSVYEVDSISTDEYRKRRPPHERRNQQVYTRFELSNVKTTIGGLAETGN